MADCSTSSRSIGWSFAAYLISFFIIGIIWVNHHVLIKSIALVDRTLLFLNLVLLLFVVLIPFSTATAAQYLPVHGGDVKVAMALYSAVFLGMSVGFGSIFEWTLHGERVDQPLPPGRHWAARVRFVGGGLVYVVAIVIALFNAIVAFVLIAPGRRVLHLRAHPSLPRRPGLRQRRRAGRVRSGRSDCKINSCH